MLVYKIITNNSCPNNIDEELLLSTVEYTVRNVICPQVVVLKMSSVPKSDPF
jgi:hypothetical protein